MRKRILILTLCMVLLIAVLPGGVAADIGPKAKVQIAIEGLGSGPCYGTLLSKADTTGPARAWKGGKAPVEQGTADYDIWAAFVGYQDADGFYFLQKWWDCTETGAVNWNYYPPDTFKLLLYYPESNTFQVSGVYERYAFHSEFAADAGTQPLTLRKSYSHGKELLSLSCRVVLTVLIEIAIALLFGLRGRALLRLLAVVNMVTQLLLNGTLYLIWFQRGSWAMLFCEVVLELAVFVIEALLYTGWKKRIGAAVSGVRLVGYAFMANLASCIIGFLLVRLVPGLF